MEEEKEEEWFESQSSCLALVDTCEKFVDLLAVELPLDTIIIVMAGREEDDAAKASLAALADARSEERGGGCGGGSFRFFFILVFVCKLIYSRAFSL